MRRSAAPAEAGEWKVLGWDASGVVRAVGPDATLFKPGDEVFYAGSITRSGTNAEFHLVDERIVGHKPKSLDWAEAGCRRPKRNATILSAADPRGPPPPLRPSGASAQHVGDPIQISRIDQRCGLALDQAGGGSGSTMARSAFANPIDQHSSVRPCRRRMVGVHVARPDQVSALCLSRSAGHSPPHLPVRQAPSVGSSVGHRLQLDTRLSPERGIIDD